MYVSRFCAFLPKLIEDPMARRTKAEAQETRRAIMQAAMRQFSQQGWAATSLCDVAREAGVTRGAIYWHFQNKSELLMALWQELCEPISQMLSASLNEEEPDPLGQLERFLLLLLENVTTSDSHREFFRLFFNQTELNEEVAAFHRMIKEELAVYQAELKTALRNAISRRQLPADLDVAQAAVFIHCALDGLILNALHPCSLIALEMHMKTYVHFILSALRQGLAEHP